MANVIVVGTDGSRTATKATEVAADLAARLDSRLHVVCAYDRDEPREVVGEGGDRWMLSRAREARDVANQARAALVDVLSDVSSETVLGKPADALVSEAARLDARILVVGNKRPHGIARLLGSVASHVARDAPCDVYIAHTVD